MAGEASSQFNSGVKGTVHDPVQAVVPGAEITVINVNTQLILVRLPAAENTTASSRSFSSAHT
jgi:hypothetical protein